MEGAVEFLGFGELAAEMEDRFGGWGRGGKREGEVLDNMEGEKLAWRREL